MGQQTRRDTISLTPRRRSLGHAFLAASVFFGVGAQLLLKFAMLQLHARPDAWLSYFWIPCGLAVYAVGTGFWMLCLRVLDLSYAYPFTGLSYVMVLCASWLLFNDVVGIPRIAGVLLICAGVVLIPTGPQRNS
jgi:multidrug transporter EmrE-like cation transporter